MAESGPFLPDDFGERYAIERELGHGATATVYLARDRKFESREVAIKVLSEHFALPVPRERFLREIQTTAKLNHPHIVTLLEAGLTRAAPERPFYVMRFIDGEVLRDLIARGPLELTEALRIARQVASALGHAHRHGVIHRDIKPGNIMLEDGHTWVTDFGIARALAAKDSDSVTSTGVTIGTPAYMSPEQAMGRGNLDARSDIYSLGCVLYEMLAGKMPFDGPDVQVILNKHLAEPLPPIRDTRPDVPERVAQLLEIALAKKPDQRFATAADFADALSLHGAGPLTPTRTQPVRPRRRVQIPRWVGAGIAGAAVVAVGFALGTWAFGGQTLDPTAYFVVPFARADGVPSSLDAGRLLRDALTEWTDIRMLGGFEAPTTMGAIDASRARDLALEQHAGHYIRGEVSPVGGSLRVRAALYTTTDGSFVRESQTNLPTSLAGSDSLVAALADRLLFADSVVAANGTMAGTRSFAARHEFARGLAAVQEWELATADAAFQRASDVDPTYSQAHLWLAQVRFWSGEKTGTWNSSAVRAAAGRAGLSARDRTMSDVLVSLGRGDVVPACHALDGLARRRPTDFAAWYGLANCLKGDDVVIRDPASPSGWRYRSSYHHALQAYQRAFQLLPSIHRAMRTGGYQAVRFLLMTSSGRRAGRAIPPDTTSFLAWPVWQGDSLVLLPFQADRIPENRPSAMLAASAAALRHQRELFREIATSWVAAFPTRSEALEALALSLEMLGDPSSLNALRQARQAEPNPRERLRLASAEVWLRLKFAIPSDISGMRAARALADSLLRSAEPASPVEARALASLAALTGRANLAAALSREAAPDLGAPGPIAQSAPPLVVYAALGGPADSLRALEHDVVIRIDNVLPIPQREPARMAWLARAAQLAFPDYQLQSLVRLDGHGDDLVDAQAAYLRGDTGAVVRIFDNFRSVRAQFDPSNMTLDVLAPESALLTALGNERGAIAWLDPTLNSLAATAPLVFNDPARAASLVRAMALRAELAARAGDPENAARWARAVTVVWLDADEFLQPIVQRMIQLTK